MVLLPHVEIAGIRPELLTALLVLDGICRELGAEQGVTVTSIRDGRHSRASLHYAGQAADVRIWGLDTGALARKAKQRLSREFDVVLESDHLHVEWQPK